MNLISKAANSGGEADLSFDVLQFTRCHSFLTNKYFLWMDKGCDCYYTGYRKIAFTRFIMPSLHLAYDELTAIVRCLNSHFRTISVRRSYDIVRFLGVIGSS